ncbi:LysR family transcriptional regulator [Devosia beringensis]|uniref:LysR family transcriptional regulator n=1 Tax=Devosia beringensis TaxID=2657486 RepID=UPI00186B7F9A|nr:LysR family transcriptional regulator [Devosia beringensis]
MRELRQFVEVASRRSISAAAKHLNISQPALSRAIQKLEDSYGAPLFVRNGAGVALSPYGSALYSRAVRILPALDEAREEIEQLQGRAKAAIRIAAGDLWGLAILPDVVRDFAMTHPQVVVQVEIADEGTRLEGLRNGVYDLVFGTFSARYGPVVQVEFQPLVRQATFIYCDQDHPLRQRELVGIEELLARRWISPGYEDDAGPGSLGRLSRDFAVRVDTMMNALLLLRHSPFLMSASSGFQMLFRSFGIEALDIEDPGQADDSGVIYPARSLDRPAVRDFLQLARQTVTKLPLPTID